MILGFFLRPKPDVEEYLIQEKSNLLNQFPDSLYTNHPVHSTVFLLNINSEDLDKILNHWKRKTIEVEYDGFKAFQNDPLTKANTVYLKICPNEELFRLQENIVKCFSKFSSEPIRYEGVKWEGDYMQSYKNYGYPFVGNHWLPHFTLGSINGDVTHILKRLNFNRKLKNIYGVLELSLYKIAGDSHTRVI